MTHLHLFKYVISPVDYRDLVLGMRELFWKYLKIYKFLYSYLRIKRPWFFALYLYPPSTLTGKWNKLFTSINESVSLTHLQLESRDKRMGQNTEMSGPYLWRSHRSRGHAFFFFGSNWCNLEFVWSWELSGSVYQKAIVTECLEEVGAGKKTFLKYAHGVKIPGKQKPFNIFIHRYSNSLSCVKRLEVLAWSEDRTSAPWGWAHAIRLKGGPPRMGEYLGVKGSLPIPADTSGAPKKLSTYCLQPQAETQKEPKLLALLEFMAHWACWKKAWVCKGQTLSSCGTPGKQWQN